jgi:HD superfamily phosphohydrolase
MVLWLSGLLGWILQNIPKNVLMKMVTLRKEWNLKDSYLVYPTLGYGRFEHTLGVLGRVSQILQRLKNVHSIEAHGHDTQIVAAIDEHTIPLRLAALFHDVGHCVYSHVSERAVAGLVGNPNNHLVNEAVWSIAELLTESGQIGSEKWICPLLERTVSPPIKILKAA